MFPPTPVISDAPGRGFFVAWPEVRNTSGGGEPLPLLHYGPPWRVGGDETEIEVDPSVQALVLSPSGRYLAVGRWAAELHDLQTGRIALVEQPRSVTVLCFDPQEQRLMAVSEQQLTMISIASGEAEGRMRIPHGAASMAHHPGENVLLAVDGFGQLLIVDPIKREIVRRLFVDGPSPLGVGEQGAERLRTIQFTPNGQLLLCAGGAGVRVYEWPAIQSAETNMPLPLFAADAEPVTLDVFGIMQTQAGVHDIAHDAGRGRMLFCGLEGRVRAMDLISGDVTDVFAMPGRPPTYRLAISRDGSAVACLQQPGMFERTPNTPRRLQVWKLL
jgi:hypothetical protein